MSSTKLGFTFYPQDWWSSDTFFEFTAFERYVYLECLFQMYRNNGYMKTQKTQFENRARLVVDETTWVKVTNKFIMTADGFTSPTVNMRLKKAITSRENGALGGRPAGSETQKTQSPNLKRKRKRKEYGTKSKIFVTVKAVYAADPILKIYSLVDYFTVNGQIESLMERGWTHFASFITDNPGRVFNDEQHLYNAFKEFCIRYPKDQPLPDQFKNAAFDRENMTLEAWEKQYSFLLKTNEDFRKHFGYERNDSSSKTMGVNAAN